MGSEAEARSASAAEERTAWFRQARLGMFIHWGLYSVAGGSWKTHRYYGVAEYLQQTLRIPNAEYAALANDFDPVDFDAGEWVRFAKRSGFKHIVITAKHHEGFAMYKSDADRFNIVEATPFGRDPIAELAQAAQAEGLRLGFYYSQYLDWRDPDAAGNDWEFPAAGRDFQAYMRRKAKPQLEELLTRYGPIGVVWFDIPGASTPEESQAWADLVHRFQPEALVSSRIGNGLGDFENYGDNEVPPRGAREKPWEALFTHNHSWGFVGHDKTHKTPRQLIRMVANVASRGGNTIINVGPEPSGRLPPVTVRAFEAMGRWLSANGTAIYGAEASPLDPAPWGVSTVADGRLFLHVFERPSDGGLLVPGGAAFGPDGVNLLASGAALAWRVEGDDLWIDLPDPLPDPDNCVVAVDTKAQPPARDRTTHLLSKQYSALSLDVATAELGPRMSVQRISGWGYFGHTNYFSSYEGQVDAEDVALWRVRVIEPGPYWISLEYAAGRAQAGREGIVEFAGQLFPFEVLETGESDSYRLTPLTRHDLGIVEVSAPGAYELTLRPGEGVRGAYRSVKRPVDANEDLFTFRRFLISPHR
jgi:alpha-L-fucosidase